MKIVQRSFFLGVVLSLTALGCRSNEVQPTPQEDFWGKSENLKNVFAQWESPEKWLPAKSRVFLRIEDPSALLDREDDPLSQEVWRLLEGAIPGEVWDDAAKKMGHSRRELLLELFGRELVLCDISRNHRRRAVVFSRSRPKLFRQLPEVLNLSYLGEEGSIGDWKLFQGEYEKRKYIAALGGPWLAVTGTSGIDHLKELITSNAQGEKTLSQDPVFNELVRRLPSQRDAIIYSRDGDGSDRHCVSLTYEGDRVEAHYAAKSAEFNQYLNPLHEIPQPRFGPLPNSVFLAGTISLVMRELPGQSAIDLLIFPSSFKEDILEKIQAPIMIFFGQVGRSEFQSDPGFVVPALGIAIRMKDPVVRHTLDRLLSRLHFLLSVGELELVEGFFGGSNVNKRGMKYKTADFRSIFLQGNSGILSRLAKLPQASLISTVAYGVVDDYYLIATQEKFFEQWKKSLEGHNATLKAAQDFPEFKLQDKEGLLVSVVLRGKEFSSYLKELRQFVKDNVEGEEKPKDKEDAREKEKIKKEATQLDSPFRLLVRGFENRRLVSFQVWKAGKGYLGGILRSMP